MGRRVAFLVLITAALAWPGVAYAASGSLVNGVMNYTAGAGESNSVVFTRDDSGFEPVFRVVDAPQVVIAAQSPCFNGATQNEMQCPVDGNGSGAITILTASLGDGNDTIQLLADLPTSIGAGGGTDTMTGGPAADFLRGGQENDQISGGAGNDQIVGDDPGVATGGVDNLDGGDGDDSVDGQEGNDAVRGGMGNDTMTGGGGDDVLLAEATDDGADVLNGGDGIDTANYALRTTPTQVSLDDITNDGSIASGGGDNVHTDVENVLGGSAGDNLSGSAGANMLDGGAGNDLIDGNAGADDLRGEDGDDALNGGVDNDTLNAGAGNDTALGGDGNDGVAGSDGSDALDGNAGDDVVQGQNGDDALAGGDGTDLLMGGADNDNLDGGTGPDQLLGDDGIDTGDYSSRSNPVGVTLDGNPGDGEFLEGDNVQVDVENLRGGSGADTFIGSAAANSLDGGAGEDYSDGGAGSDRLTGGEAGDVLRSRGSTDPDTITCGPGPDFVIAKTTDTIAPDCDRADRGVNQKPKLRDSAVVTPSKGTLQMSPTGIVRRVPLQDKVVLPLRSIVDTVAGAVNVTSALTRRKTQSISLEDGAFNITQAAGALTQFALQGGDFSVCPTAAGRASASAGKKTSTVRTLWAKGKGKFRTKGRYAAASIRGTRWQTADRCDGTLIRVTQGVVAVRDLVKKRTVVVRAGRSYLARR